MKGYERVSEQVLPARLPVILRLDGNSFSRLTSRNAFDKPFDGVFTEAMDAAAIAVMDYCSGAEVAYSQSDEISILLRNDQSGATEPFLGNRTQKLASLCASKASVAFNRETTLHDKDTQAVFDCRAFVMPPSEVNNYFLWRQRDCFKNCISTFAYWGLRKKFGRKTAQKMLHGLSTNERQELVFQELGVNPNDIQTRFKRGVCIYKENYNLTVEQALDDADKLADLIEQGHVDNPEETVVRSRWSVDEEIPLFDQNQNYIRSFQKMKRKTVKIERKSMTTGKVRVREIDVTQEQLDRWENGELAQEVFPDLSADDREFIMTGIVSEEWDDAFEEEEDDEA